MLLLRAYAKINLGLRILRKREDGYHDIETIFHRVNLYDEITFEQAPEISLTSTGIDVPVNDDHLCLRAARLLQSEQRVQSGVRIMLNKKIPVGAGLGGGSSDAAATLIGLNSLWQLGLSHELLSSLALRLGSDVPYFLKPGSATATGRGELLEYFDLDLPYWIVLVYPDLHISTAWAYGAMHIGHRTSNISLKQILLENMNDPRRLPLLLPNDFEPLVLRTHEPVARVKKMLYDRGAVFAQMSGSGSSVYGLFRDENDAIGAADEFRQQFPVFVTPPHFQVPINGSSVTPP